MAVIVELEEGSEPPPDYPYLVQGVSTKIVYMILSKEKYIGLSGDDEGKIFSNFYGVRNSSTYKIFTGKITLSNK